MKLRIHMLLTKIKIKKKREKEREENLLSLGIDPQTFRVRSELQSIAPQLY